MGLSSLNSALSGLKASQLQISILSSNVSNAGTAGFSRKTVSQEAQSIGGVTVGVTTGKIVRKVDLNLSRDLWTQVSAVSASTVEQFYLGRVEQFHGPPDAELSIAAEISRLRDSFAILSDSPGDQFSQAAVIEQARDTATKMNDLSDLLNKLRNDVQTDMVDTVTKINTLLVRIAEANRQVQTAQNIERSTALNEDNRDQAIKELSELIDISFFKRGDGVLVVQTNQGVELADETARKMIFNAQPLSATTFYPDSAAGVYIAPLSFSGDPTTSASAIQITATQPGGRLGGLLELRDDKFPRQLAQLDEIAHKMARRFEAQGLRLFTNSTGIVPLDTAPNPNAGPPALAVPYIGFSSVIQVNPQILNDRTLLQQGTTGVPIANGSNEVIRRIMDFTFGSVDYQIARNSTETTAGVDLLNTGGDDLQTWLGLFSSNNIQGNADLTQYNSVADLLTAGGSAAFGISPADERDRFTITFNDPDLAIGAETVTIDLRDASLGAALAIGQPDPVGGGTIDNAAEQLRALIQAAINALPVDARYAATVSIGNNGELNFSSTADITIAAAGAEPITDLGFSYLGIVAQTKTAVDPYFEVAVGNNTPTRITIDPNDTITQLVAQLNAVPGLAVDESEFAVAGTDTGFLRLRPGDDYTNPLYGGDITITGGPFVTNGASYAATGIAGGSTRAAIDDGVNIVSALFGTYTTGPLQNVSPVTSVSYGSETSTGSGTYVSFREDYLGPGADVSTQVIGATSLIDFSQKMINQQAQELVAIEKKIEDDDTLRNILEQQLANESGVNLDEELGKLIVYQTAYNAAARVISAVDELFQELLRAI